MPSLSLRRTAGAEIVASTHSADPKWDRVAVFLDQSNSPGATSVDLPAQASLEVEPTRVKDARNCVFISGRSGSGKSFWASSFCQKYHALHGDDRPVCLVSALAKDQQFDSLGFVRRIKLESLLERPLSLEEFPRGGLVVVDDVEAASKAEEAAIEQMLTTLLTMGRHARISVLVLKHLSSDYRKTRLILHESTMLVMFPAGCAASQMQHVLSYHAGMDKDQIRRLRKLPSRWVAVRTSFPGVVFHQGGCYLTNAD